MVPYMNINNIILNTLNVPSINNFSQLARELSISKGLLYYISCKKDYCYTQKSIPKKDGSERVLSIPSYPLKIVQKWILTEILEKITVSDQSMAFVPGKNGLLDNANKHKNNVFVLEMDITDFFGSINSKTIFHLFQNIGYNKDVSTIFSNICTYNNSLPQGGVTSPYLANLVCYNLDKRLTGFCDRRDIVYTRYADDMSFSCNNRIILNRAESIISRIVEDEGFIINPKKTRYLSEQTKKTVTGITINSGEAHANRELKRALRAAIFNSIMDGDYSKNDWIRGCIAFVNSIETGYKDKMIKYIEHIVSKPAIKNDVKLIADYNNNKIITSLPDILLE